MFDISEREIADETKAYYQAWQSDLGLKRNKQREHYQIGEDDRSNGAWAWDPAENRDKEDKEIK